MEIGHPHVATTTTAATADVATRTTIAVTTGDVTTAGWRTIARSATGLPPPMKDQMVTREGGVNRSR
jgi:hypothetical protein